MTVIKERSIGQPEVTNRFYTITTDTLEEPVQAVLLRNSQTVDHELLLTKGTFRLKRVVEDDDGIIHYIVQPTFISFLDDFINLKGAKKGIQSLLHFNVSGFIDGITSFNDSDFTGYKTEIDITQEEFAKLQPVEEK